MRYYIVLHSGRKEDVVLSLELFRHLAKREQLEALETYTEALEQVLMLARGSLIDLQDVPTIVIPDLHARRELLLAILETRLETGPLAGQQVFELLQQGRINVVCVGDIMHSEERAYWVINDDGEWSEELLDKEMVRSLGTALMVMYLKIHYPDHFYCLRGNHDDIAGELTGDFRKFVGLRYRNSELVFVDGRPVVTGKKGESQLIRDWVLAREGWGQPFLEKWARFEHELPLFARASYFVVSHTLPLAPLNRADLENPAKLREVAFELTSRRGINPEAIVRTLTNLGMMDQVERWFYGHSHVFPYVNGGRYEADLDGLLVRLNNPKQHVYAYVPASTEERHFDPELDVYIKSPTEMLFSHKTPESAF
uniref:Calcineurin-like phosphoesterase domain-containing protein n=1 Tax=Thermosporothrix sp. COM3 TaxID=2490863 RepID=A0A455SH55_9CHLR|nr:hypothetical protein KTC_25480 [Thermosporothrix sp. COM3]